MVSALSAAAMVISVSGPAAQGHGPEPGTVKCRPAPYMVAHRGAGPPKKVMLVHEGAPTTRLARGGQPCILMRREVDDHRAGSSGFLR